MTFTMQQRHDQLSKRFWDAKAKYEFYQQTCQLRYQTACAKLTSSESDETDIALDLMDLNWNYQRDLAYLERTYVQELRLLQRDFMTLVSS